MQKMWVQSLGRKDSPEGGKQQPNLVLLPWGWTEEPGRLQSTESQRIEHDHGWSSLVGCTPLGHEESDTTERLHFQFSLSCIGEGNRNPLQCSCLENPRDGGAWWAAVCGVAQSQTRLKRLSSSSRVHCALLLSPVWGYSLHTHMCLEQWRFS